LDADNLQSKLGSAGNALPFPTVVAVNIFFINIICSVSGGAVHIVFLAESYHIS